jgi:hypothetical protein
MDLEHLRYPIGRFTETIPFTAAGRAAAIEELAALPSHLRAAVDGLSDARWIPRTVPGDGRYVRWSITWPTAT